ncbi:MAG TPA: hypothetical protein VE174_06120, partial [Actinomycetota bacterium]|nr:hypothetical protein [Actinomycetota bacterium]
MDRWQKVAVVVLGALALASASFSFGMALSQRTLGGAAEAGSPPSGPRLIDEAYDKIINSAVDAPSEEALARGAVKGMIDALKKSEDPYALFYSPKGFKTFQELTTGSFSGIGVWLKDREG